LILEIFTVKHITSLTLLAKPKKTIETTVTRSRNQSTQQTHIKQNT